MSNIKFPGMWPRPDEPRNIGSILRACFSRALLGLMVYVAFFAYPYVSFLSWEENKHLALECFSGTFVTILMSLVTWSMLYRRDQMDRIFQALTEMNRWSSKLPLRPVKVLQRNTLWANMMMLPVVGCFFVLGVSYSRLPFLYKNKELVYYIWYPIDGDDFPKYEAVFLLTSLTHAFALLVVGAVLNLFNALMVEAVGQLRLLGHNLKYMCRASTRSRLHEVHKKGKFHISTKRPARFQVHDEKLILSRQWKQRSEVDDVVAVEKDAIDVLKICVQHHYTVLAYVEEVGIFFNWIHLQMLVCTLVPNSVAVVLLLFAETPLLHNPKTLMYIYLVAGSNAATAIGCWIADEVTTASSAVREAVYESDWLDKSESFKKILRIMMSHSNQPTVVKVAGFVALSMETYYSVTKLTYSYFMATWTYFVKKSR